MMPYGVKRNWNDTDYAKCWRGSKSMRKTVKILHRKERRIVRQNLITIAKGREDEN